MPNVMDTRVSFWGRFANSFQDLPFELLHAAESWDAPSPPPRRGGSSTFLEAHLWQVHHLTSLQMGPEGTQCEVAPPLRRGQSPLPTLSSH